jgi:hypothetical protein
MKKIFSVLTVAAFLAVSVSYAQEQKASSSTTKTEAVKSDAKSMPAGCKSSHSCCKNRSAASMNCSPKEKAACEKAGKAEAVSTETKPGTN